MSSADARRAARTQVALGGLARFVAAAGWPPTGSVLGDPAVIEAFCYRGLAGRASATQGTYRSVLRAWAGLADGGRARRGPGYRGAAAPVPYTPAERAQLAAIAVAQPLGRRASAVVMTAAGLGAGVRAGELMALRGSDVAVAGDGSVAVVVGGRRARTVPVTAPYGTMLAAAAAAAGERVLFRPEVDRGYKNAVCNFVDTLASDPQAPRLRLGRARSSFICGHIAGGAEPGRLLEITGLVDAGTLAGYAAHVDGAPTSTGAWRAHHTTRPDAQQRS